MRVVAQICPLLANQEAELQGAVLADLLAIWLAGHVYVGDPAATRKLRDTILGEHLAAVRRLIEINAQAMGTDK